MPRFPLFASVALCAALLLSACTTPSDPVAGTWVEPIPGMPGKVQGFRLEADGGAPPSTWRRLRPSAGSAKGTV